MESIPPEKIFLEWKDEEMLAWDSLIYNTKLSQRHIIATQPKSVDSIIHDFKFNFDIHVTIKDLEERNYLIEFFDYTYQSLYPSNEDLKKILFYDMKILERLSLATGLRIMAIIFDYLKGRRPETNIQILKYETPRRETVNEILNIFVNGNVNSSNTAHVNESLEDSGNYVYIDLYDSDLKDERIKYLSIESIDRNSPVFPPNLVSLDTISSIKNAILPESLKYLSCDEVVNTELHEGLISLTCYLSNSDFQENYNVVIEVPSSLLYLNIPRFKFISNPDDLTNLQYLITDGVGGNASFPKLKFLKLGKYEIGLSCPDLEYLFIDNNYRMNISKFTNLKILQVEFPVLINQIPKSIKLFIANYPIKKTLPDNIKYLVSKKSNIKSGNYVYLKCKIADVSEMKELKIVSANKIEGELSDDVIVYRKMKYIL